MHTQTEFAVASMPTTGLPMGVTRPAVPLRSPRRLTAVPDRTGNEPGGFPPRASQPPPRSASIGGRAGDPARPRHRRCCQCCLRQTRRSRCTPSVSGTPVYRRPSQSESEAGRVRVVCVRPRQRCPDRLWLDAGIPHFQPLDALVPSDLSVGDHTVTVTIVLTDHEQLTNSISFTITEPATDS